MSKTCDIVLKSGKAIFAISNISIASEAVLSDVNPKYGEPIDRDVEVHLMVGSSGLIDMQITFEGQFLFVLFLEVGQGGALVLDEAGDCAVEKLRVIIFNGHPVVAHGFGEVGVDAHLARAFDAGAGVELGQGEAVASEHGLGVLAHLLEALHHVDQAQDGSGAHQTVNSGERVHPQMAGFWPKRSIFGRI